jgi:hypothetical protein
VLARFTWTRTAERCLAAYSEVAASATAAA